MQVTNRVTPNERQMKEFLEAGHDGNSRNWPSTRQEQAKDSLHGVGLAACFWPDDL